MFMLLKMECWEWRQRYGRLTICVKSARNSTAYLAGEDKLQNCPMLEDVATFRASEKHKHSAWNESWQSVMLLYIMTQPSFWQHLSALNLELQKDTNRCSWICINLNTHALEIKLLVGDLNAKRRNAHFLTCKSNFTKCYWQFSRLGYHEPWTFRFELFENILPVDLRVCYWLKYRWSCDWIC